MGSLILLVVVIAAVILFIWAEKERREVKSRLEQTSAELEDIRKSTQRGGQEVANEVLGKVRRHIIVAEEPQPTVATIVDINRLKESSEFYNVAENGDHLIITEKRAILYDPDSDIILDVVPVRLNRNASPSPETSPTPPPGRTSPSPTTTASPSPTP